jgi:hypothetical protein
LVFRKAGFDALQKKAQENQKREECKKTQQQQQQQQQKQQHGAWGPVFKNKQHFVNMHIS